MSDFDYSKYQVAYSSWSDPFAQQPSSPTGFQYSKAPVKPGSVAGPYKRPLVPVTTSLYHVPGVVEEPPSEDSEDDEGEFCKSSTRLPFSQANEVVTETVASSSGANATASTAGSGPPGFAGSQFGSPPPPPGGAVSANLDSPCGKPLTSPAVSSRISSWQRVSTRVSGRQRISSRIPRRRRVSVVTLAFVAYTGGRIRRKGQEVKVQEEGEGKEEEGESRAGGEKK